MSVESGQEILRSLGCTIGCSGDEVTIQCDDVDDAYDVYEFLEWLTNVLDNEEVRMALSKIPK